MSVATDSIRLTFRAGMAAANGAIYFEHQNLNEVRAFLRAAGLGVASLDWCDKPIWMGWCSQDETRRGMIEYIGSTWCGCWWVREQ
jgi:hypothetical protein